MDFTTVELKSPQFPAQIRICLYESILKALENPGVHHGYFSKLQKEAHGFIWDDKGLHKTSKKTNIDTQMQNKYKILIFNEANEFSVLRFGTCVLDWMEAVRILKSASLVFNVLYWTSQLLFHCLVCGIASGSSDWYFIGTCACTE